jgi:hypothetical protein
MSRRFWRCGNMWCAGWIWGDYWLTISRGPDMACLDLGRWRIRYAGPGFRPLFSERYGHQKWHKVGRLGVRRFDTRSAV